MHVRTDKDGKVLVEFDLDTGNKLAEAIVQHNEDNMPSALLELASLLHKANYQAHDEFRQPPHAWEPGLPHPSLGKEG